MTIEQEMIRRVIERLMSESEATQIVALAKIKATDVPIRWGESLETAHTVEVETAWMIVIEAALEWIDVYIPRAWNRPLFM